MTAVAEREESAVPAPPPPPLEEHSGDNYNPNRSRGLYRIWNRAAVFGPISDNDIYAEMGLFQGGWQEYVRYHPGTKREDATRLEAASNRWYFDHEVGIGLKHGYLKRGPDGLLSIGTCPPEHTPPSEPDIRAMLTREDSLKALDVLRNKTNPARMKPTREGRARLKASIKEIGQLYPIRRWHPGAGTDWIIVDGTTRKEILESLGIDPRYEDLPSSLTALDVLIQRIHHEVARSSKDETTEARDAYIAELARLGFTQKAIGEKVGLTERHVRRVLSQADISVRLGQEPPDMEIIKEWVRLNDGGWSTRDIAADYIWSKSTVDRYIKKYRDAQAAAPTVTPEVLEEMDLAEAEEILEEAYGENLGARPADKDASPATKKKAAAKVKPIVEQAKKDGVAPKSAVKTKRSMGGAVVLVKVDREEALKVAKALRERFSGEMTLDQIIAQLESES